MRSQSTREHWRRDIIASVQADTGVADQTDTCVNGTTGCPGPVATRASELPCSKCFFEDGGRDA